MAGVHSQFLERTVICVLGGVALAGASAACFWAGSVMRTQSGMYLTEAEIQEAHAVTGETPGSHLALVNEPWVNQVSGEHPGSPSVTSTSRQSERGEDSDDSAVIAALERLEKRMAVGMKRARDSVVALEYKTVESPPGSRRLATGVVINSSGDVLSVRIDPPSTVLSPSGIAAILARDAFGRKHAAKWVAGDPESGLTLLRIDPQAVKPIKIAAEGPVLGGQVFVVGNPFGLGHTVSRGHIAGLDRALKLGQRQIGGLIQVQAPLYPGDSGAVVTNVRGQLLGLIRSGLAIPARPGEHAERDNDFGFAIATPDLLWVADQLRARGRVDRAYLGVRLQSTVPSDLLEKPPESSVRTANSSLPGAYLEDVLSGTPAAVAGLQAGDAIIAMDGLPIHSSPDLTDRLDRLPAQVTTQIEVMRGQGPARRQLKFVLRTASRPDLEPQVSNPAPLSVNAPAEVPKPLAQTSPTSSRGPTNSDSSKKQPEIVKPMDVIATAASVGANANVNNAAAAPSAKTTTAPAVSIPAPARSPLREPVHPAQGQELSLTLPRAVIERLEQLERRLEKLERQAVSKPDPHLSKSTKSP
jgi:S1-C subfamily serine protease